MFYRRGRSSRTVLISNGRSGSLCPTLSIPYDLPTDVCGLHPTIKRQPLVGAELVLELEDIFRDLGVC
jgi:hypothetical protein